MRMTGSHLDAVDGGREKARGGSPHRALLQPDLTVDHIMFQQEMTWNVAAAVIYNASCIILRFRGSGGL
jgi:hypothetical protein